MRRPALPGALRALLALALLLAAASGAAQEAAKPQAWVEAHAWDLRVLDGTGTGQVTERVRVGPGSTGLPLHVPASARDVQAFLATPEGPRALPWAWRAPGLLGVTFPWTESRAEAAEVTVTYVVTVPPTGFAFTWTPALPTRQLAVTAALPEGWVPAAQRGGTHSFAFEQGTWRAAFADVDPGETVGLQFAPPAGPSPLAVLSALLLAVLAGTMARAVTARGRPVPEAMGLVDHVRELQGRLKVIVIAVALLMLGLFTFALQPVRLGGIEVVLPVFSLTDNMAAQTFRLVAGQFVPPGVELVVVDPISGAMTQVEVALFLAVLVASPLVGYELGAFLMPALLPHERRTLLRAIPAVTLLFVAGALFAYLLMVPTMMQVLYSYAAGLGARPFIAVDRLVSFAIIVTLIFGLAFELPVIMVLLAKLGLATPRGMAARWRHVVVGLFILAAIITPDPSVVSQLLVAVPLLMLYVVGLVAARSVAPPAPAGGPVG